MSDDDKTPIDQLVEGVADLFVYAPIGLFFEGPSLLPRLARQGRVHANNAPSASSPSSTARPRCAGGWARSSSRRSGGSSCWAW